MGDAIDGAMAGDGFRRGGITCFGRGDDHLPLLLTLELTVAAARVRVPMRWRISLLMGLAVTLNVTNYTLLAYMPTYLESQLGMTPNASLTLIIIGQLAMMALIPFAGSLSDRVGRKPLWWASIIGLFLMAI